MPFLAVMLRVVVGAVLLFCILCGVIPRVNPQPSPDDPVYWSAFGFDACALPCYAGMTPGETRFDQAPFLLEEHIDGLARGAFVSGSQVNFSATHASGAGVSGLIQPSLGRVGSIRLNTQVPVDVVVRELGAPDCVWVDVDNPSTLLIVLYWTMPGTVVGLTLVEGWSHPFIGTGWLNSSATIGLFSSSDSVENTLCAREHVQAWRGFAPAWRYARGWGGQE